MTKLVRVENADTSDYKVVVEVWDKTADGEVLASVQNLDYATAMAEVHITSTRFLKVKEITGTQN